jgi:hypothetical protein
MSSFALSSSSKTTVEQWIQGLPLAKTLADLFPTDIFEVARLTPDQITDIIKLYSSNLALTLREKCSELREALTVEVNNQNNNKFTFLGGFGGIGGFHESIYNRIGNPNPNEEFLEGMRSEHANCTDMFETSNYHLWTNALKEWLQVVEGEAATPESMGHGRVIRPLQEYIWTWRLQKRRALQKLRSYHWFSTRDRCT